MSSIINVMNIGALVTLDPRIVGGRNAKPGEIPYQVNITIINKKIIIKILYVNRFVLKVSK